MNIFSCFFAGIMGLGGPEVLLIFAVLLLLFGGSKLPELAKGLGKSIKEFKHASSDEPESLARHPETLDSANASQAVGPQPVTPPK